MNQFISFKKCKLIDAHNKSGLFVDETEYLVNRFSDIISLQTMNKYVNSLTIPY